jgi:hypothetical protein
MEFTLENIQSIRQEARNKLKAAGYEEIRNRVQEAASLGHCAIALPYESLDSNKYILTSEHAQWLRELGFKVKWIDERNYLYIDWED